MNGPTSPPPTPAATTPTSTPRSAPTGTSRRTRWCSPTRSTSWRSTPTWVSRRFTSHYANPLGEFEARNAAIESWADGSWDQLSDPDALRRRPRRGEVALPGRVHPPR
ncbi:arabinofuranosyltransferase [Corynebacterium suedekumii]|nr:arabinofuranosyltransferase [Corynebacterium suedekumii]